MLFRLGMSICEVKNEYDRLSKTLFKPGISRYFGGTVVKPLFDRPRFSVSKLETEIRNVVNLRLKHNKGCPDEAMLASPGAGFQDVPMFVCAVTKRTKHTINFRTYKPRNLATTYDIPCSIVEAARATSAAPFYFPSKKIRNITFWDGGLQNNNPICQLLGEFENDSKTSFPAIVISLGTGRTEEDEKLDKELAGKQGTVKELQDREHSSLSLPVVSRLQAVLAFVTHSENEHRSFARVLHSVNVDYHRLNPTIKKGVGLSHYKKMPDLIKETKAYLGVKQVQQTLLDIARVLARRVPELDPVKEDDEDHPYSQDEENLESKDNSGRTPLSWAAQNGRRAVVGLLLEKGANLETQDNSGQTPLLWATLNRHEAVIKLLGDSA